VYLYTVFIHSVADDRPIPSGSNSGLLGLPTI